MRRIMGDRCKIRRIGISILVMGCLATGLGAGQGSAAAVDEPLVTMAAGKARIEWSPQLPLERTRLTVSGQGVLEEMEFEAGKNPAFDLRDRRGEPLPDGAYKYRLTFVPELDDPTGERLAEARAAVDADVIGELRPGSALPRAPFVLAGTFAIRGGSLVDSSLEAEPVPLERPFQPSVKAGGDLVLWGNLTVRGATSLAVLDPEDGRRSIHYAAPEGPEVGTYLRGTARLSGGEAVVELPAHFAKLTEARGITVQLTPVGAWSRLYVAERSPHRLVVRQAEGDAEAEFDYLVQGVRSGYAGFEVERGADEEWVFPEPR